MDYNPAKIFGLYGRKGAFELGFDGDIVIVEKGSYAENGDIVVAFIDGEDATVKRFFKENGQYRLQPENDTMSPIILDKCEILGKVIGLKRYY